MSLRFIDGFDHYATADFAKKWTANDFCTISAGNGRRGGSCMRHASYASFLTLTLDNQPTWIVGCAMRITALPAANADVLWWRDGGTVQCALSVQPGGLLAVYRGPGAAGGTLLGVSSVPLSVSTYTYIELLLTIHSTLGAVTLRLNGSPVLTLTNINTQNTANAYASTLRLGNGGQTAAYTLGTQDVDDVYVCDGTGSAPHNTLLGDCKVDAMLPNGDTGTVQWTPSTGTVHFDMVNEPAPNITDYISSSTIGQSEAFQMQNIATTPSLIYGMQVSAAALKSDAGARSIKVIVVSNLIEAESPDFPLSTSQTYVRWIFLVDPNTGTPWTPLAVNGALGAVRCA